MPVWIRNRRRERIVEDEYSGLELDTVVLKVGLVLVRIPFPVQRLRLGLPPAKLVTRASRVYRSVVVSWLIMMPDMLAGCGGRAATSERHSMVLVG